MAQYGIEQLIDLGAHDGCCEVCDKPGLDNQTVVEGDLGWYCSEECREEQEGGGDWDTPAWERKQLGILG